MYVLIVDPTEDVALTLAAILIDEGFHALTASNATEALRAVQNLSPAVVLLDLYVQNMADQLIAAIPATSTRSIPIIGMSTMRLAEEQVARRALSGYLVKPFEIDDLIDCVQPYLVPDRQRCAHADMILSGQRQGA